jgi:hypothetical protein
MEKSIYRGKAISFRLNDCPELILEYLNEKKEEEGRGFSNFLNTTFQEAITEKMANEGEKLVLNLPGELSKEQKEWLNSPLSKQLISQWVYQLITTVNGPVLAPGTVKKESSIEDTKKITVSTYHSKLASSFFEEDE